MVDDKISFWNDGKGEEWRENLPEILNNVNTVAFEPNLMPPLVQNFIKNYLIELNTIDLVPIISEIRMIKSVEELNLARHAGLVAIAMMKAGHESINDGCNSPRKLLVM